MANRYTYPSEDMSPGNVNIEWWFDPNNTANPTSYAPTGHGIASVTRSAVGTFVITLQDSWVLAKAATANLTCPLAGPWDYAVVAAVPDVSVAKTVTVLLVSASGTPLKDLGPSANSRVYVQLTLQNTTARA